MTAIALPSNAILSLENAKTMPPVALAISAGLLAYLSAGFITSSSRPEAPAIVQAPTVTVKAPRVLESVQPTPKIAHVHSVTRTAAKHRRHERRIILTTISASGERSSVLLSGTPETATVPSFGRAGKAPPLTQSHIFEGLFHALTGC